MDVDLVDPHLDPFDQGSEDRTLAGDGCALAGVTTVPPVCATAPTTTPPSSLIRTDTGSRRIAAQAKPEVSPNQNDPLPLAPVEPNHGWAKTLAIIV